MTKTTGEEKNISNVKQKAKTTENKKGAKTETKAKKVSEAIKPREEKESGKFNQKLSPLFTPWKIGKLEIKNRIVLCPMGGTSLFGWMERHHYDKDAADFFMQIAKNNTGLLITGVTPIRNLIGGQWVYKADGAFKKLKPYMEEFHKTGAKLFVQLTAGFGRSFSLPNSLVPMMKNKVLGAICKPIVDVSRICAAPSVLPLRWCESLKTREITKKEIEEMVDAFAKAAKKCKDAGVDGVEIHAVHEGYLLDQFTTSYTNHRTDEYGGSFENRYRFATDIVRAIKKECGEDFPVSLRYSVVSKTKGFCEGALPDEKFEEAGRNMEESERAAKYLQDAGYDMLNADNGTYDAWYWAHPPEYMPENCNLKDVSHIKKFVDIPVVCAGNMTPEVAAKAIKAGEIDAMGVAREFLVDNEWVTKLLQGRENEIRPCIRCHNACLALSHYNGVANACAFSDSVHMSRCALNPMTMDGGKYDLEPTTTPKKIAIIGGGIGGMETALVATKLGHMVTIYEKTNSLGGVFVPASAPSFKMQGKKLLQYYCDAIKRANIDVRFNTEISAGDLPSLEADEIVIATGSTAKKLKVAGAEHAIEAVEYLRGAKVGENVVVIGGGLSGCEIAYDLHLQGKKPVIVESLQDLMVSNGLCLANSSYLRDYFRTNKVPVHLESKCVQISEDSVIIENSDGKRETINADSVISAIGYNSNPLAEEKPHIHVVGDAYSVGNLRTVIWRAWDVVKSFS